MSHGVLDTIFVSAALLGVLISAWYYVRAVLNRDRPLSRTAAAAFVGFCMAAGVYLWVFR